MTDGSYSPGDYNVGLFGIEYQPIPEVVMTISDWQAQYGNDTQPQKGDIIYIMRLHKIYEVGSSTVVYAIQSMPTHYKLSLTKYTPTASRRENPDLKQSLEEMTVSQEDLFGDIISQEVADTVAVAVYTTLGNGFDSGDLQTGCFRKDLRLGFSGCYSFLHGFRIGLLRV